MATLAERHTRTAGGAPRPVHGAPHPNQWLDAGDALVLTDFDRFGAGDPESDAATFLADIGDDDVLRADLERVTAAFHAGYDSAAPEPLRRDLLSTYQVHHRIAKARHAARAVRADGDARAARHLARALALCAEVVRT